MRTFGLLLLAAMLVQPADAAEPAPQQPVTVAQLEHILASAHPSDRDLSRNLYRLELTQRLSPQRFATLSAALPGSRSREALRVLADLSAFLDLPAADLPAGPPPDAASEKQMLSRAIDYVAEATHRLPDFLVTRRTTRFEDLQVVRGVSNPATVRLVPFRRRDRSTATVLFRDGEEVVQPAKTANAIPQSGLIDHGVFGVLLAVVTTDVLNGSIGFDHWETVPGETPAQQSGAVSGSQPADSPPRAAVFRFLVPESQSHYTVDFCCYYGEDGWPRAFHNAPRYHGELAIDPDSGAILRLVVKTDLEPSPLLHIEPDSDNPLLRADILVEYGPVVIGGRTYICPLRSISVETSWTRGSTGPASPVVKVDSAGHLILNRPPPLDRIEYSRVTALNEYEFERHHLFRGDVRMLPGAPQAVPQPPR